MTKKKERKAYAKRLRQSQKIPFVLAHKLSRVAVKTGGLYPPEVSKVPGVTQVEYENRFACDCCYEPRVSLVYEGMQHVIYPWEVR